MRCLKRGFYRIKEPEVNTFQFLILISKYKILFFVLEINGKYKLLFSYTQIFSLNIIFKLFRKCFCII